MQRKPCTKKKMKKMQVEFDDLLFLGNPIRCGYCMRRFRKRRKGEEKTGETKETAV